MSKIRPFRAYRPRPDLVLQVATPPYDVMSSEEAKVMVGTNEHSFLHVTKSEIDLPADVDHYDRRVYEKAAESFQKLIKDGALIRDEKPCYYVYQQRMGNHVQAGFVAGASVEEYQNNLIKKHEFTRKDKEDDRTNHVDFTNANTGPVFLAYRDNATLDNLLNTIRKGTPTYDFTSSDDFGHTVWIVNDENTLREIDKAFESVNALYVADGHHRSAAASRVYDDRKAKNPNHTGEEGYCYFQAVIFPANQLYIMDYNRVVKDLNGLTAEQFLAKVQEKFTVTETSEKNPNRVKTFGMYLGGKWYRLEAKDGTYPASDPVKSLDVAILQENLLSPILGIGDPRTDKRIDFVGGIRGTKELEKRVSEGCAVAFSMFATSMEQLMNVADAGQVMPPKSTWFEPKLRDGILVRSLDETRVPATV